MIKGIIFDFGGPILHSKGWRDVFDSYDVYYNLPPGTVDKIMADYLKVAHAGDCTTFEQFFEMENYQSPLDANQLTQIWDETDDALTIDTDMVNLIRSYKSNYKIALLSNFTTDLVEVLERFQIDDLFDAVVNSSTIRTPKPYPQAYWHTLEQISLAPEQAVFIDDLPLNVKGAEEVGIKGILYENFEQTKNELENFLN
jgi:epoxide hydrolase-like predicted phosphatase